MKEKRNEFVNYLSLSKGKIRERATKEVEGAVMRVTKTGKEIWEHEYYKMTGKLVSIGMKEHPDYGKFWEFTFRDGTDTDILTVGQDDKYAKDILVRLPNVDLARPFTLQPWYIEKDNKGGCNIYQGDQKIPNYYISYDQATKKSTYINGMPTMPKSEDLSFDQDEWKIVKIKITKFLKNMVAEKIVPKLKELNPIDNIHYDDEPEVHVVEGETLQPNNDMPF